MSNQKQAAQGSAAAAETKVTFGNMDAAQKMGHIAKVFLFFLSFGFAYPNIFTD